MPRVTGAAATGRDVTVRKRTEGTQRFLDVASEVLASSLDMRMGCEGTRFRFLAAAYGRINSTWTLPNQVGWPIAGTVLFAGATYALGSRTFARDLAIAASVSLVTWLVFDGLLGVDLPGGPLMGVFG